MMHYNIVFDLDGTLADTQKIHQQIESGFLKDKGIDISGEEIGHRFAGRSPQEWIAEFLNEKDIPCSPDEISGFITKKDSIVISMLEEGKIELMPNVMEMLTGLFESGHNIGISSGACREFIDRFIAYFRLTPYIIASTSSNEVKNKKPAPDVFLRTFEKIEALKGRNNNRIVVGDGLSDAEGGKRSEAFTIWISPKDSQNGKDEERIRRYVDRRIYDFNEIMQDFISGINPGSIGIR